MKTLKLTLTMLVVGCVIAYSQTGRTPVTESSTAEQIVLEQYLSDLGKSNDRFFTIEEGYEAGAVATSLSSFLLRTPRQKMSLQEAMEALRRDVPNFSFIPNKENPHIIHIIDARLHQQKGYGLEGIIKSIDFKGTVNDLIIEISKQRILVSTPTSITTEEMLAWDLATIVRVRGTNLAVRDALSNFVPLNKYSRVIWVSRTKLGPGEPAFIRFTGPRGSVKHER